MKHGWRLLPMGFLLLSGCAIHTPYAVVRYWADYNTERECNAQIDVYELLPPKPVWVRLMQWGYNVGPVAGVKPTSGVGSRFWSHRNRRKNRDGQYCPPPSWREGYPLTSPPAPSQGDTIPSRSPLQLPPPPAPAAADEPLEAVPSPPPVGPTTQAVPRSRNATVSQAGWLFAPPTPRRSLSAVEQLGSRNQGAYAPRSE